MLHSRARPCWQSSLCKLDVQRPFAQGLGATGVASQKQSADSNIHNTTKRVLLRRLRRGGQRYPEGICTRRSVGSSVAKSRFSGCTFGSRLAPTPLLNTPQHQGSTLYHASTTTSYSNTPHRALTPLDATYNIVFPPIYLSIGRALETKMRHDHV